MTINHQFDKAINAKLRLLAQTDNWHALLALLIDYSTIAAAVFIGETSWFFYPVAVLVIGARQRGMATVFHDAVHLRAAKSPKLNGLIGRYLSGYLIFQSFKAYRKSHVIMHHGCLGDPRKDPDYQFYVELGLYNTLNRKNLLFKKILAPLFLLKTWVYLRYLIRHRVSAFGRHTDELFPFFLYWMLLFFLLYHFKLFPFFLLYWVVPYITAFQVIGYFLEISEHYPLVGLRPKILESTRNRFSHWTESFFLSIHAENYHLTHHLKPGIPFWNLHNAHMIMMQDSSYRRVNETFGGVFLSSNGKQALVPALILGNMDLPCYEEAPAGFVNKVKELGR